MSEIVNRSPSTEAKLDAIAFGQLAIQRGLPIECSRSRAWVGYLLLAGRLFNPAEVSGTRWVRA